MAGIRSETRGDQLFISGSTYEVRTQLKEIGAKWNPAEKAWTVPAGTDISRVTAAYEAMVAVWRAEGAKLQAAAAARRRFHGPCCQKAVGFTDEDRGFDGPLHYKCEVHGVTRNNYTGN